MLSGYGSSAITNNPFVTDPTNAQARFPDLSTGSDTQSQWSTNTGIAFPPSQGLYQQQQVPQLSPGYNTSPGYQSPSPSSNGIVPQPTGLPFKPTSSFGQQLAANMSGTSYGYLQAQPIASQQQQSYQPAQQQLRNSSYLSEFDPYANIGQGWSGESQTKHPVQQNQLNPSSQFQGAMTSPSTSTSPSGMLHPREFIRTHKAEIEAWDNYTWKQLLLSFESLKDAWEGRVKELEGKAAQLQMQLQYGTMNYHPAQIQQEGSRLQGLHKDAKLQSDSVAASAFQMQEVFQGYRLSADAAGKRRVREATNAALQGLPDWPSPLQ
ncbi:hypothetical protein H0H93_009183 [Arthromyces matolae]|nr:hypothetical protein H0H93_009183 [Arthromyces matolae]